MNGISLLLSLITLVMAVIFLVNYGNAKGKQNKNHAEKSRQLVPSRSLSYEERDAVTKVYGIKLKDDENLSVYQVKGLLGYIATEYRGSTTYEYSLDGLKLHNKCIRKISKKPHNVGINGLAIDSQNEARKRIESFRQQHGSNPSQERLDELQSMLKDMEIKAEIFFERGNTAGNAFLLSLKDWNLRSTAQLVT